MIKITTLTLSLLLLAALWTSCQQTHTKSSAKTERIVSLSPHLTETLYALGQQNKIVAVSDFCDYPEEASSKEKIGGLLNPNLEKMIYLQPDLIVGTPAHKELAAQLQGYHIRSLLLPNDRLADIFRTIDTLGVVLNCRGRADSLQRLIRDSLNFYQHKAREELTFHPAAMLVIGREAPLLKNITAAGGNTFLSEMWTLLGGTNSFAALPAKYAQINTEAIQQKNPDCIIEFKFKARWNVQKQKDNLRQWLALDNLKAARLGHVFVLNGNYTLIPGPRIYLLARDFLQIMQRLDKK
jgi:iron complex transport system substrate-binding protein